MLARSTRSSFGSVTLPGTKMRRHTRASTPSSSILTCHQVSTVTFALDLLGMDRPPRDVQATDCARRSSRKGTKPCSASQSRSEEHTSELQSRENIVCRLLLEKKK